MSTWVGGLEIQKKGSYKSGISANGFGWVGHYIKNGSLEITRTLSLDNCEQTAVYKYSISELARVHFALHTY